MLVSANAIGEECAGSFVGIATTSTSIKAVLANTEESVYDATLWYFQVRVLKHAFNTVDVQ